MKNNKTPAQGVSRRKFIQSSATAAFGIMVLGSTLGETEADALRPSPHKEALEQWLLRTGRDKIDPTLYKAVERRF